MAERMQLPWIRIAAESAAIVLSILLAFWIDAWWDGRRESALELEWLNELEAEFAANMESLELRIAQQEAGLDRFERFWRATPASLESMPQDTIDSWLYDFVSSWTFDGVRGASVTLSHPAGLTAVSDPEIRLLAMEWLGMLDDMREEASSLWEGSREVLRVLTAPRFQGEVTQDHVPRVRSFSANHTPGVLALLRRDDRFLSELSVKMYYQYTYVDELHKARTLADSLTRSLRRR